MMTNRRDQSGQLPKIGRSEEATAVEWDVFYSRNKTEWRSSGLGTIARDFLLSAAPGKQLLEVGCGLGDDIEDLVQLGFEYEGVDISEEAIKKASARFQHEPIHIRVGDFLSERTSKAYSAIYEKGVFHGLGGRQRRESFVRQVADSLEAGGIWISVCGAASYPGSPTRHGAIFLRHLIEPAENYFEVLKVVKARYGTKKPSLDFNAWFALFRRW
jgi:SAM-dependent methyltransferase